MREDKEDGRARISQNYKCSQNIVPYFTGVAADLPTYLIACSEFPIIPFLFHTRLSACMLRLFSEENVLFMYNDGTA